MGVLTIRGGRGDRLQDRLKSVSRSYGRGSNSKGRWEVDLRYRRIVQEYFEKRHMEITSRKFQTE